MTFTSAYSATPDFTGAESYDWQGEIVGDVASNKSLLKNSYGYLIIKITTFSEANTSQTYQKDKFLAVHWKNLTAATVEVSTPYKQDSTKNGGVNNLEEAKTEYTVDNGYFDFASACTKQ